MAIGNLPVEGEDAEGELPEAVVLAEHDADGAAEVLVPARHRGAERDRRPHPPRRHPPHHVLRRRAGLRLRHREVRLHPQMSRNSPIIVRFSHSDNHPWWLQLQFIIVPIVIHDGGRSVGA